MQGVKAREVKDSDLNETLRYCMLLTGIRAQNLPAGEEILVLKNFVRNYLGGYTAGEFRLAFELAVAGQLETEAKFYESFDCVNVSRVMKSYRKYANGILEFSERSMKPETRALPPADYNPLEWLNILYKDFLHGTINWKTVADRAYDIAYKNCEMNLSKDDLMKCIEEAKTEVMIVYQETKKREEIKELKDIPIETSCKNDDVNHVAKLNCLKLWFERMKGKGVKVIIEA
jgi:hypothetical protein